MPSHTLIEEDLKEGGGARRRSHTQKKKKNSVKGNIFVTKQEQNRVYM